MDKNKIIIIAVVVIIAIVAACLLILGNSDITLVGTDAQVTVPKNYTLDVDAAVATGGDVKVAFIGSVAGSNNDVEKFYSAVAKNGNASGYKNYTNGTIGDFKYYEFSANIKDLENISTEKTTSGDSEYWTEYNTDMAKLGIEKENNVAKMRRITFINEKDKSVNDLIFFTNNTDADLNTAELNGIINSIKTLEK